MATLQTIRDRAGLLVAIVIGLSILAFVLGDLFGSGGGTTIGMRKKMEIAEIRGESISYLDYDKMINDLVAIYKLSGQVSVDEATMLSIQQQTWDQLVREYVMGKEYKKLGLGVSSEELFDLVQGENPHIWVQQLFIDPQTGVFNRSSLINFLKNMEYDETGNQKAYWIFMEDQIHNDKLFTKYLSLVRQGLYVTSQQTDNRIAETSIQYDFKYLVKRYSTLADSLVTIAEGDLKKYYIEHKQDYEQEASRNIEYIIFEVTPSNTDVQAAEDWINDIQSDFESTIDIEQYVNANSDVPFDSKNYADGELPELINDFMFGNEVGATYGPYFENETFKISRLAAINQISDSVRARHILISPSQTRSYEKARNIADSLKNLIENGTDFALLAILNSDDQGSAQLGGDLGWFYEGAMVQPFNDACFYGKKGDLTVVESQFGFHIIETLDQGPKTRKLQVGTLSRVIQASSATFQNYYSQASRFAGMNNTYDKFISAVEEQGLNLRKALDIKDNDKQIPGLESPRTLIRSVYETDENQIVLDFNDQAVFELENKFVVAFVTEVKEKGAAPFEQVRADVELKVRQERKGDELVQEIRKAKLNAQDIESLAMSLNVTVEEISGISFNSFSLPGLGIEPKIQGTLSNLNENELSKAIKGNNGVYVIQLTARIPGEKKPVEDERSILMTTYKSRVNSEVYNALKETAHITDKRSKFY